MMQRSTQIKMGYGKEIIYIMAFLQWRVWECIEIIFQSVYMLLN